MKSWCQHFTLEVMFCFRSHHIVMFYSTSNSHDEMCALHVRAGIPVEGKSSECLICIKYRILILIIIIISLGQIFYRILQTHHACTHARAHTRAHAQPSPASPSAAQAIAIRCRPTVTVRSACDNADRWLFK